jgi:hypothetical protein
MAQANGGHDRLMKRGLGSVGWMKQAKKGWMGGVQASCLSAKKLVMHVQTIMILKKQRTAQPLYRGD